MEYGADPADGSAWLGDADGVFRAGRMRMAGARRKLKKEAEYMKTEILMVGLDLDGTVFNNNKEITAHTRNVLEEAIRQGCVVLPATGRPEIGLPKAF